MDKLTVGTLKELLKDIPDNTPIYLGDDTELNGIHQAFFAQKFDKEETQMVSYGALTKAGFLIS